MLKIGANAATITEIRASLGAICQQPINDLRQTTPGVISATVATSDGFTLATTLPARGDADKLSAMAGSINALGSALARQAGRAEPQNIVLETLTGKVISMSVPGMEDHAVLTVVTNESVILGHLLWACRKACQRIFDAAQ